ncbi:MAG: hypothetical protein GY941_15725 [Planctomycetes bacterium]|nr:hypothetical protein [Planctomycetota bacterium]
MWAREVANGNGSHQQIPSIAPFYKAVVGSVGGDSSIPVGFDRMNEIYRTMPENLRVIVKSHYRKDQKPWLRLGLSQSKYYRLLLAADYHTHGRLSEKGLTNT